MIVRSSASCPSGATAFGFQYSKYINTLPFDLRAFLGLKLTWMDACLCPIMGESGLILAASITSAEKPSTIPPVSAPFCDPKVLNMVTLMSEILVVEEGFLKPGMISVRNCDEAPVPPSVTVACVPVIEHVVIVNELPEMRQLGVPVGTTKEPLVKKLICTLSPERKLLFKGACSRIWKSVVEPIVVDVSNVT